MIVVLILEVVSRSSATGYHYCVSQLLRVCMPMRIIVVILIHGMVVKVGLRPQPEL